MINNATITIIGKEALELKIARIKEGLIDFKKPFKNSEIYLEGRFTETFEKEGEPKWKELSQTTLRLRKNKSSSKILQDTGRLKGTMTGRRGKTGSHKRIYPRKMEFGISSNYETAHYMQLGAFVRNGWGKGIPIKIPARPYIHFVNRDIPAIEKIFQKYLDELIV